jgi:hypothetical protein
MFFFLMYVPVVRYPSFLKEAYRTGIGERVLEKTKFLEKNSKVIDKCSRAGLFAKLDSFYPQFVLLSFLNETNAYGQFEIDENVL